MSSTVTVKLKRNITPTLTLQQSTQSILITHFHPDNYSQTVVESTGFYLLGNTNIQYIDDDGNGVIRTFISWVELQRQSQMHLLEQSIKYRTSGIDFSQYYMW